MHPTQAQAMEALKTISGMDAAKGLQMRELAYATLAALSSPSSTVMDEKGAREVLEALIAECEKANKRAVDEIGMGLLDLNVISRARSALESPSLPRGEREAFEAWCPAIKLSTTRHGPKSDREGEYFYASTVDAWAAWQARASLSPRPDDDSLWDETLKERDCYHDWADRLAERISTITGVDIGEHSSANNPWQKALNAADEFSYGPPPEESLTAPAPSAAEPVALEACKKFIDSFSILDDGPDESDVVHAQCLMVEAIKLARSAIAAPPASAPSAAEPVSITDEQIVAALEKAEHDYNFPRYGNSKGDWVSIGQRRTVAVFRSLLAAPPAPQPTEAESTIVMPRHLVARMLLLETENLHRLITTALDSVTAEAPVVPKGTVVGPVGEMRLSVLVEGLVIPWIPADLPVGTKLYTHPAPSAAEDAKDAERWRHLRDSGSDGKGGLLMLVHAVTEGEHLPQITCEAVDYDKTIDAAMAKGGSNA